MLVGYARVSSAGQSLEVQRDQLTAAGCERIFEEKRSGRSASDRPALKEALRFVREGDTLVITRFDRLARSAGDLLDLVKKLEANGVGFRCLQQDFDMTGPMGKLMRTILAAFAEWEADIRAERQREGQDKAKANGVRFGRPKSPQEEAIRSALEAGESPMAIHQRLGVARSTVYRVKGELARAAG